MPATAPYELSHLQALEAEAIHVIREVAAEFERPVLLFSGGKDSAVMLHVAAKAFAPARLPFPKVVEETGPRASRNRLQTTALLDAIEVNRFDAVFGGGRRDEEKARAKERVFSFRDEFGQWDPKNQRPELWSLYNGRHRKGEHIRVFPLSNWTELDIWQYIATERVELPSIYFAHRRRVFERDGMWLAETGFTSLLPGEEVVEKLVRYRTVGDATITGAVESAAKTPEAIVEETAVTRVTERGATRGDDRFSEAGMEDRKREGYF